MKIDLKRAYEFLKRFLLLVSAGYGLGTAISEVFMWIFEPGPNLLAGGLLLLCMIAGIWFLVRMTPMVFRGIGEK